MDKARALAVTGVFVILLLSAMPSHGETVIKLGTSTTSGAAANRTSSASPASNTVNATAAAATAAKANTTNALKWPTFPKLVFNFTKVNDTKINFTLPSLTNITFASTNKTIYLSSDPKNAFNITALVAIAQGVVGELMAQLATATPLLKILAPILSGNATALNPVTLLQQVQQVQQQVAWQPTNTINLFSGPFTVSADGQLQPQQGANLFGGKLNASSTLAMASRRLLELNATQQTNAQKIGSRINTVMSDAWLIAFTGFRLGSACLQLLLALVKSFATGTVVVDANLVLQITDLATNLNSAVSYLLYAIFKENADSVAPLGLIK